MIHGNFNKFGSQKMVNKWAIMFSFLEFYHLVAINSFHTWFLRLFFLLLHDVILFVRTELFNVNIFKFQNNNKNNNNNNQCNQSSFIAKLAFSNYWCPLNYFSSLNCFHPKYFITWIDNKSFIILVRFHCRY